MTVARTHAKIEVKGKLVGHGRTDTTDCITFPANAVGKHKQTTR